MSLAALTSKGQLTVPKQIRQYLSISAGDKVDFVIEDDGRVIVEAKTIDVDDIFGMFKCKKGVTVDDMKKAVAQSAVKRFKRYARN